MSEITKASRVCKCGHLLIEHKYYGYVYIKDKDLKKRKDYFSPCGECDCKDFEDLKGGKK